ncbi:hypothetical protein Q5P01_016695 [Channa striata]|uniref:Mitochondrial import inner membrane translocase subunit Tim29 n=1 Tax=Channa striata TaxID=64152 RepID=A0AA88SCR9_CHASR|nr:hypothetical protein Q5P01_016695 [Channa striata]
MFCAAAETAAAAAPAAKSRWEALKSSKAGVWCRSLLSDYKEAYYSSFDAVLLERSNQLSLLSPWNRNGSSDGHVQSLVKLRNEGRLRHASLGVLSLVYYADCDPDNTLYETQCSNLSVRWRELHERVLDVGFAGRWWILNSKMQDYDVNDDEFKHLPPHMQVTLPPSVQEVERNESLHKESWLALTLTDEDLETNVIFRKEESTTEESQMKQPKQEGA